jgi:unsaturated chondroitin disaccharide hydrolase
MPLKIDTSVTPVRLLPAIDRLFELSARKILQLNRRWKSDRGTPVFTIKGLYTSRGWTEWTQGFQYGSAILQFDATNDRKFLELGRRGTVERMATHLSHIGVHDHGFNNMSTYGNLRRLMLEGRLPQNEWELGFYELALKVSGAIQAARWTPISQHEGYIYSFNGPHSLFIDTMRSLRSLALAHQLGHVLMGERDRRICLLERLVQHARATARYGVYYGEGRDIYDVEGRVAHESLFNTNDGGYRCPSTQQGFSPFTTWTRGLAWALLGFTEELQFLRSLTTATRKPYGKDEVLFLKAAEATAHRYLLECYSDGIPVWDTGAPAHQRGSRELNKPADPFKSREPVDSSAAAIAAQGFIRLGQLLAERGRKTEGLRLRQAGLTIAATLFQPPYLSEAPRHEGLLLHSIYHRPNGWDYVPPSRMAPQGESSLWGDYHLRELALMIQREAKGQPALKFF